MEFPKILFPDFLGIPNSRKCSIPELQDSRSKKIREWPLPNPYTFNAVKRVWIDKKQKRVWMNQDVIIGSPQCKWISFSAFAQLVTLVIFFSAWDRSHVKWDNSQNSTQKMRTWVIYARFAKNMADSSQLFLSLILPRIVDLLLAGLVATTFPLYSTLSVLVWMALSVWSGSRRVWFAT